MPTMPPLVSTSSTRRLRASPKACPLSHGVWGQETRRRVVWMAVMVRSGMRGTRAIGAGRPILALRSMRSARSGQFPESVRLDAGELHHLAPFLGFDSNELGKVGG